MEFVEHAKFQWGRWLTRIILFSGIAYAVGQIVLPVGVFGLGETDLTIGCVTVGIILSIITGRRKGLAGTNADR